jgi:flagellar hook protein FlgE
MGLFNTMQTSVSGMAAQANALSTIGDNIANSSTVGYKDASAQFSTVLGQSGGGNYSSGGVQTDVRYGVTTPGTMTTTTSSTDLAIQGSGFFVVSPPGSTGSAGQATYMTRAGSFVPDSNGNLVNTAGYNLMGYPIQPDGTLGPALQNINISSSTYQVAASTSGTLTMNLPSAASIMTASAGPPTVDLPSANTANSTYTNKTSVTVYDNLGTADLLDVYYTKTADNTWEVDVYQHSQASASGGFPYNNPAANPQPMATQTLTFDAATGALTSSPTLPVTVYNGNTINFNISSMTQLATNFGVTTAQADGNAPSKLDHVTIAKDGTLTDVYASGVQIAAYKIPVATVASPDNLTPLNGNVYQVSETSGAMIINDANTNGAGAIASDTLEGSTVDLATELTNMIVAQRSYEANSKVLQAGSDLLGVLNRLSTN